MPQDRVLEQAEVQKRYPNYVSEFEDHSVQIEDHDACHELPLKKFQKVLVQENEMRAHRRG